jgi:hypothetical protein
LRDTAALKGRLEKEISPRPYREGRGQKHRPQLWGCDHRCGRRLDSEAEELKSTNEKRRQLPPFFYPKTNKINARTLR